jgi:hypothetical protein
MSIKYKNFTASTGRQIHVFDGLVPLQLRSKALSFAQNSRFTIGWMDSTCESAKKHSYMHSSFTEEDDINLGLITHLRTTEVGALIEELPRRRTVLNLSVPSESHFPHNHDDELIVLYYVNTGWRPEWHGETIFYSEDLSEIELALPYTPGRVVVFDATIPHSYRPQSTIADHYRFTLAMGFDKKL